MPFNKGDFTQQGVNGHVNSTVRLNEKRLVNIDLTSNEEAEGCTITGTVTDLLNNKVYGIGAGVSGNIEITENGENINVAPYATATVNVAGGGGDNVHYCTVTLIPTGETANEKHIYIADGSYTIDNAVITSILKPNDDITDETTMVVPYFMGVENTAFASIFFENTEITASNAVNCYWDTDDMCIYITDPTANSSITISGTVPK